MKTFYFSAEFCNQDGHHVRWGWLSVEARNLKEARKAAFGYVKDSEVSFRDGRGFLYEFPIEALPYFKIYGKHIDQLALLFAEEKLPPSGYWMEITTYSEPVGLMFSVLKGSKDIADISLANNGRWVLDSAVSPIEGDGFNSDDLAFLSKCCARLDKGIPLGHPLNPNDN